MTTTADHDRKGTPRHPAALPPFRTPVRGHAFAPRPPLASDPAPGQPASLVPEPTNPADPYAVAVWVGEGAGQWRIGYLDRGVAARVAPRLSDGLRVRAQVDGWTREPDGRWQRPVVRLTAEPDPAAVAPSPPQKRLAAALEGGTSHARGGGVWGRPPGVARRTLGRAGPRS